MADLRTGAPPMLQSLARVLGVVDYDRDPTVLNTALDYLLNHVKPSSNTNLEARRLGYYSIIQIVRNIMPHFTTRLSPSVTDAIFDSYMDGLDDYTIDQRGDVGSWIRTACMHGLTALCELMITNAASIPNFEVYFPPSRYQSVVVGILKQGIERLDNVRKEAGECFMHLLGLPLPTVQNEENWCLPGLALLDELFRSAEQVGWNDGGWLFPRALRLLEVQEYRKHLLSGMLLSIGSRTDTTQRAMANSLVKYAQDLPVVSDTSYSTLGLITDMLESVRSRLSSNAIVIPVFQAFNVLLERDLLRQVPSDPRGLESVRNLESIASKNVTRLKSILRIQEAMKIIVNLMTHESLSNTCIPLLADFLTHPFPHVRTDTAEYLYTTLQNAEWDLDTEEVETIILETEWISSDIEVSKDASTRVVDALLEEVKSR